MTVWTLTPNPALDFTYHLPTLNVGNTHRIEDSQVRAGGKGVNVSRVLAQIGKESTATGFLGGANGKRFSDLLAGLPEAKLISSRFVKFDRQTRMSIAVVEDDSAATVLNESGEAPSDESWEELLTLLRESLQPGDLLASCGSFAGDSSPEWMTRIVDTVHEAGARILVDATGENLVRACAAGADFVKPNDLELKATTGLDDVCEGAAALLAQGVGIVITSEGENGMSIHGPDGSYHAKPVRYIEGNPTGAGDASVAAWCAFIDEHTSATLTAKDLKDGLPMAVALSGAAVARPVAGEVDLELFKEMLKEVEVKDMECH
ncbi:MAG: hexose kinase [Actinomycetaceae bacterium]|nr:hexose kinase [Actinomycetaceae bacterium]